MYNILGFRNPVPLTAPEMAKSLKVAVFPVIRSNTQLETFVGRLCQALTHCGVKVISYKQALAEGVNGRIGKDTVLIAPGEGEAGNLAIDHVPSLLNNTVVSVLNGSSLGSRGASLQNRIDGLVSALVWHMAHIIIYVDDATWTLCTMNGSMDTFSLDSLEERTLYSLIPKLAAPIIPPQIDDFDVLVDSFDPTDPRYDSHVADMVAGANVWHQTGLLASQTKISDLAFRTAKYRRIASAYLSWRTGMSYGFLARQLPTSIPAAVHLDQAPRILRLLDWDQRDFYTVDDHLCVGVKLNDKRLIVRVPTVTVLCTRSGCEKTKLVPATDLLQLHLSGGVLAVHRPKGIPGDVDCQPSFDTWTILAHAVGNSIVASVLARFRETADFYLTLKQHGVAMAHWHGFLDTTDLPRGYYLHGAANLPVSCSTPQAAIHALSGKLASLQQNLADDVEFLGDVHVEPSHGTNITGKSLCEMAFWVSRASSWNGCTALE